MKKNYIHSDGNGGLDANIQRAVLRKWGPLVAALFIAISGLASQIGEEAWSALLGRSGDMQKIEDLEIRVEQNRESILRVNRSVDDEIHELRSEIREIKAILLDDKGK